MKIGWIQKNRQAPALRQSAVPGMPGARAAPRPALDGAFPKGRSAKDRCAFAAGRPVSGRAGFHKLTDPSSPRDGSR